MAVLQAIYETSKPFMKPKVTKVVNNKNNSGQICKLQLNNHTHSVLEHERQAHVTYKRNNLTAIFPISSEFH